MLRRTARKTWRYFDTFVTEADGWLVPDNYQEAGDAPRLARRTSPTNVGMGLLSLMAAHDLGYISTRDLDQADRATVVTLEGLERHHGHFLNWYDTASRAPLHPRYVSTVDSGNLAGAMMALAPGTLHPDRAPPDTIAAAGWRGRHGCRPCGCLLVGGHTAGDAANHLRGASVGARHRRHRAAGQCGRCRDG